MKGKVCNAVVYVDSDSYDFREVLRSVGLVQGCEYYYALHDLDIDEKGELKKPHYHIIMRFENDRQFSAVARDLGIPENMIEKSPSFKGGVQYLIHQNAPEKHQYDKSIISGNGHFEKYLKNDDSAFGMLLMDAIYSGQVHTIHELYQLAKTLGCWSTFRRGFVMYNTIIREVYAVEIRSDKQWEYDRQIAAKIEENAPASRPVKFEEVENEVIPEFGERATK